MRFHAPPATERDAAVELQSVLVDLAELAQVCDDACRNVRGPHARSVADDLCGLGQRWNALRDELAERIVLPGGAPDVRRAASPSPVDPCPPGPLCSDEAVHLVAERVAQVGSRTRMRIERVAEHDGVTDLLGRVAATLEDDLWTLARSQALVHGAPRFARA